MLADYRMHVVGVGDEVRTGPGGIDLTAVPNRVPSGLVPPGVPTPAGDGPFLVL